MEAEEVDIGEITFDSWWEVVCVDLVENKVEVGGDRWDVGIDDVDEDVNGVCVDPRSVVLAGVSYCCADVTREGVSLGRCWWRRGGVGWGQGVCIVC